jgi:hypothetical protein
MQIPPLAADPAHQVQQAERFVESLEIATTETQEVRNLLVAAVMHVSTCQSCPSTIAGLRAFLDEPDPIATMARVDGRQVPADLALELERLSPTTRAAIVMRARRRLASLVGANLTVQQ